MENRIRAQAQKLNGKRFEGYDATFGLPKKVSQAGRYYEYGARSGEMTQNPGSGSNTEKSVMKGGR